MICAQIAWEASTSESNHCRSTSGYRNSLNSTPMQGTCSLPNTLTLGNALRFVELICWFVLGISSSNSGVGSMLLLRSSQSWIWEKSRDWTLCPLLNCHNSHIISFPCDTVWPNFIVRKQRGGAGLPYNLISGTPFPVWMRLYCQEHTKADSQERWSQREAKKICSQSC